MLSFLINYFLVWFYAGGLFRTDARHVFEKCGAAAVQAARARTGITAFVDACEAASLPAFNLYVNGKSVDLSEVPMPEYLARGDALLALQSSWLELVP